jgi:transcriptional regulator with XRE-family HTH domain
MSKTLGRVIRQRRIEMGLTQEALAALVGDGVGQAEISRLEHDRIALPRRARLEQIAQALGLPLGTLLARSGWAGAEEELAQSPAPDPAPSPAVLARADIVSFEDASPLLEETAHLAGARIRANDVIRKTESMLRESQETLSRARQAVDRRGVPERRTSA